MNVSGFSYNYFEKECDNKEERPVKEGGKTSSEIAMETGNAWESYVYENIESGNYYFFHNTLNNSNNPIITDCTDTDEKYIISIINKFLASSEDELYLKQVKLAPCEETFYTDDYFLGGELKSKNIILAPGFSDLILLTKQSDNNGTKIIIHICDIKAALSMKLYHKIQVEIYCEYLESLLRIDHTLSSICTVSDTGYVWARPCDHPEAFKRNPIKNFLHDYLSCEARTMSNNSSNSKEDENSFMPFYMSAQKCEGCIHVDTCISKLIENNCEILLSPNLSERDAEYLLTRDENNNLTNKELLSTDSIRKYKKDTPSVPKLKSSSYFQKMSYDNLDLPNYLNLIDLEKIAQRTGNYPVGISLYERKHHSIHPDIDFIDDAEDIQIILSAHYEQCSNSMAVFGTYIHFSEKARKALKVDENDSINIDIAKDTSINSIEDNLLSFTDRLSRILKQIQNYNHFCGNETDMLSIRGYVEDGLARYNVEKTLYDYLEKPRHLQNDNIRSNIAVILTWIKSEKNLILAPYVDNSAIKPSLLQISEIVNRLFYISAFISYDLETIAKCFGLQDCIKDQEIFNRFNGNVKISYLYQLYYGENESINKQYLKQSLKNGIIQKLKTENSVIDAIRAIICDPDKKSSQDRSNYSYNINRYNPNIFGTDSNIYERMIYMLECEDHIGMQSTREPRLRGLEIGLAEKKFIELEYIGKWSKGTTFSLKKSTSSIMKGKSKYYLRSGSKPLMLRDADGKLTKEKLEQYNYDDKYVFKTNAKKLFKNSALVIRKEFDKLVPYWNDSSSVESELYKINGKFNWVYEHIPRSEDERTSYLVLSNITWPTNINESNKTSNNGIVFNYHDRSNTQKMKKFIKENLSSRLRIINQLLEYHPSCEDQNPIIDPNTNSYLFPSDGSRLFGDDADKKDAYDKLKSNQISVVVGPPGTGKTYFIVNTIASLMKAHESSPIRILLTSNSWAAIDNMIDSLKENVPEYDERIIRLTSNAKSIDKDILSHSSDPVVIGTTCWQIRNYWFNDDLSCFDCDPYTLFDLVVIDEATQVSMCNAFLPMSVMKDYGHLLIVGDEDQLGTIVQGNYEIPDDIDNVYGSIFSRFYSRFTRMNNGPITQLNECRRMNEAMTRYLSEMIYGERYTSIPNKRFNTALWNKESLASSEEIIKIIDPSFQLTLCILEGDSETIMDMKEVEKSLAADIALAIHSTACDSNSHSLDFKDFWGDEKNNIDYLDNEPLDESDDNANNTAYKEGKIGVISPYNRFNEELIESISKKYQTLNTDEAKRLNVQGNANEYIKCSTVDKFQGQERDYILACYGERDIKGLMQIKDFVFNRNRLNVVISRAKKKCIIIMSGLLAKRYKECYEVADEKLISGVEFMCGLKEYLERPESTTPDSYGGVFNNSSFEFNYNIPESNTSPAKKIMVKVYQKGYNQI